MLDATQEKLAYEYALGLLSAKEQRSIQHTTEFNKRVEEIQLELSALQFQSPLDEVRRDQIWQQINQQISQEKSARQTLLSTLFSRWIYVVPLMFVVFGSFVLLEKTQAPNIINIIHTQAGWDVRADMQKQQLLIASINPMPIGKNEVCSLWIKKDGVTHFVTTLPNSGNKTIGLNTNLINTLENAEAIISIESIHQPAQQPTRIEYRNQLS